MKVNNENTITTSELQHTHNIFAVGGVMLGDIARNSLLSGNTNLAPQYWKSLTISLIYRIFISISGSQTQRDIMAISKRQTDFLILFLSIYVFFLVLFLFLSITLSLWWFLSVSFLDSYNYSLLLYLFVFVSSLFLSLSSLLSLSASLYPLCPLNFFSFLHVFTPILSQYFFLSIFSLLFPVFQPRAIFTVGGRGW